MLFVLITDATRKRLLPGAITTLNLSQNPLKQKQNLESLLNTTKLTRDHQVQVLVKNTVQYINVCMTLNAKLQLLTGCLKIEDEQKFIYEYFDDRYTLQSFMSVRA